MFFDYWYRHFSLISLLLLPFSWVFGLIVLIRRFLYKKGFKEIIHLPIPVIIVGNITVGGTGKTPLVICLAKELREKRFHVGIVSRGYGVKEIKEPKIVKDDSDVSEVGDEAVLMAKNLDCPIVVCKDRVKASEFLLQNFYCNVIISDDGLQHYRLGRNVEIAVIDADRKFGNGLMLPAGPLREPVSRLNSVNFIVYNNYEALLKYDFAEAMSYKQENVFNMKLEPDKLISVKDLKQEIDLDELKSRAIHAVVGIGNPNRFFESLRELGLDIIEHKFRDHHKFKFSDIDFEKDSVVIMTEKDAVKCRNFADKRHYFLKVTAEVDIFLINSIIKKINLIN